VGFEMGFPADAVTCFSVAFCPVSGSLSTAAPKSVSVEWISLHQQQRVPDTAGLRTGKCEGIHRICTVLPGVYDALRQLPGHTALLHACKGSRPPCGHLAPHQTADKSEPDPVPFCIHEPPRIWMPIYARTTPIKFQMTGRWNLAATYSSETPRPVSSGSSRTTPTSTPELVCPSDVLRFG